MKLPLNKSHIYWLVMWLFVFSYLLAEDAIFSNEVRHNKIFSKNQYTISFIFPLGRTEVQRNSQTFLEEPLYISLFAPRKYNTLDVLLQFDREPTGWNIGYQTAPGFFYELVPLAQSIEQAISIDISKAYYEGNRLRIIFTNDTDSIQPITLTYISANMFNPQTSYSKTLLKLLEYHYERIQRYL